MKQDNQINMNIYNLFNIPIMTTSLLQFSSIKHSFMELNWSKLVDQESLFFKNNKHTITIHVKLTSENTYYYQNKTLP